MASFKIYNCDFGIKLNGVDYSFTHVAELQIEDPERNRLTRGANAGNKEGIAYKEGIKEPKRWTIPILAMTAALKEVLDGCFDNQSRIDVYCIDRASGSSKMLKLAILSNRPQQLAVDETAESMNVSLEFEGFDSSEVHKD
jgi:hypothetical protein